MKPNSTQTFVIGSAALAAFFYISHITSGWLKYRFDPLIIIERLEHLFGLSKPANTSSSGRGGTAGPTTSQDIPSKMTYLGHLRRSVKG